MQFFITYLVFCLIWLCALPVIARDISFSPLPMEQKEKVLRQIAPMLHFLEKPVGQHFSIKYFSNYQEILDNFEAQQIDLAFLGPLPYVQLRAKYPDVEPVVRFLNKQGKSTYTCSLVTGIESEIKTVDALKSQRLALTQPHSTCGYLSTATLLQQAGVSINNTKFRYLGSHQEVALAVVRGEFQAGGLKTSIGEKYAHLGLRFLSETDPLPGFMLVANKATLTAEQIETIRNALLQLRHLDNPARGKLTAGWGKNVRYGATTVQDSDYDVIRNILQEITISTQGNY